MNIIDKVGIEIEGGWDWACLPDAEIKRDGSVRFSSDVKIGEIVSRPYKGSNILKAWFFKNYPTHTNETCGIHVHISFLQTAFYTALTDIAFKDYFIQGMQKWGQENKIDPIHAFWYRLAGNNQYCLNNNWNPETQISSTSKNSSRYCIWNFCHSLRGTAECRLLPTFKDHEIAWSAIQHIISLVKDWCLTYKYEYENSVVEVEDESPVIYI